MIRRCLCCRHLHHGSVLVHSIHVFRQSRRDYRSIRQQYVCGNTAGLEKHLNWHDRLSDSSAQGLMGSARKINAIPGINAR